MYAVEFCLILLASLALFMPVGEFLRLAMYEKALATATHQAARAAAGAEDNADAQKCEDAVRTAFNNPETPRRNWILDHNNDGDVDVSVVAAWPPDASALAASDVLVSVSADANLYDDNHWDLPACGGPRSWIRVRTGTAVQPFWGPFRLLFPNGFERSEQSWARNQT